MQIPEFVARLSGTAKSVYPAVATYFNMLFRPDAQALMQYLHPSNSSANLASPAVMKVLPGNAATWPRLVKASYEKFFSLAQALEE